MSASDVGILLYPDDGIGSFYQAPGRLSEYLRCGIPIIASNFPGLELLVIKYDLGRVCEPTSPASIADAIRTVCEVGSSAASRRRERIRHLAERHFVYDLHAPKLEALVAMTNTANAS